jgi:formylglycine-generating enzyme required for sulfatase activity
MGSPLGEGVGYERPMHPVTVAPFRLERHEVTNAQFAAFLADVDGVCASEGQTRPCFFECTVSKIDCAADFGIAETCRRLDGSTGTCADHPVAAVTWWGARAYCAWAGRKLPTDAQWERAANGPAGPDGRQWRRYPWSTRCTVPEMALGDTLNWAFCDKEPSCPEGFNPAPDQALDEEDPILRSGTGTAVPTRFANCRETDCTDGFGSTAPVRSFPAGGSVEGVWDLAGNVGEWTRKPSTVSG